MSFIGPRPELQFILSIKMRILDIYSVPGLADLATISFRSEVFNKRKKILSIHIEKLLPVKAAIDVVRET